MAKSVMIDELHLTVRIPSNLPDDRTEEVRRTLTSADFMNRVRRAIRDAFRAFPQLAVVSVSLTR